MKKRCLRVKASAVVMMLFLVLTSIPMIALADTTTTESNVRISGQDRYGTSFAVADELHKQTGAFDNVVVAFGGNFPDALSGGYLSKVKDAPLILIDPNQESRVLSYIKNNMKSNGTVYLLGGTGVVRSDFEAALKSQGNKVKRLAGQGRYDTNLEILKEAVKPGEEILVASGANYPDSLSGSAVGKGMLLVGKTLTDAQKNWIKSNNTKKFYILGGDAAVSPAVESELKTMGTVERIGGANRYDTSRKVADRFFPKAKKVALVSGKNFPDGLSGAPIAMVNNAPIILVADGSSDYAKDYVVRNEVTTSITIGGTGAVSVTIVNNVMVYVAPKPEPTPTPEPEPEPGDQTETWGDWEYGSWVTVESATCTEDGISERTLTRKSNKGNVETKTESSSIPAIGHNFTEWKWVSDSPETYESYCDNCGKHVVGAHEHTHQFGDWVLLEDNENEKVYKRSCSCGKYELRNDFCKENGHKWGEWEYDLFGYGWDDYYKRTCAVCGETDNTMMPHTYGDWVFIDGSNDGDVYRRICTACFNSKYERIEYDESVKDVRPHQWGSWELDYATDDSNENWCIRRRCSVCGRDEEQVVGKNDLPNYGINNY